MQKQLSDLLLRRLLVIQNIGEEDYIRLFELMEKYEGQPMDLADATLVLAAEKMGVSRILTIDTDFWVYRISDHKAFDIIEAL